MSFLFKSSMKYVAPMDLNKQNKEELRVDLVKSENDELAENWDLPDSVFFKIG